MGAHHAPAHVARHTRPAHTSSTTTGLRLGALAGRGVLTASAALAMTGAGAGAALAQDAQAPAALLADNDTSLLCGILGGDRCSSDTESSSDSDDTSSSVFDRFEERGDATRGGSVGDRSPSAADTTDDSSVRGDDGTSRPAASQQQAQQQNSQQQASQIDTPPPPGEVRAINLPN